MTQTFTSTKPFALERGGQIDGLELCYTTYGEFDAEKSKVVFVFHALTANSKVLDWWPGLFGPNDYFNPKEHFIVCVNIIGSPYGSTRPKDLSFPLFTIRDIAKSQLLVTNHLGINKIDVLIGGSCGGSQALEFALAFKGEIKRMILLATAPKENPWVIGIHEVQRMAMQSDPNFGISATAGLKVARAIGMISYRTPEDFNLRQKEEKEKLDDFKASSYMQYQGTKFEKRFDSICYYYLTKCLDSHDLGRGRGGINSVLSGIEIPTDIIALSPDLLIDPSHQKEMSDLLPNGRYHQIESLYGHDGFLLETKKIVECLKA